MAIIKFIPGVVVSPAAITLPGGALRLDSVQAATIIRLPKSLADHSGAQIAGALANHPAADVVAALIDHPAADIAAGVANHTGAQWITAVADHAPADVVACITDHAVHAHDLVAGAVAVVEAIGSTGAGVAVIVSATGQTIVGGGVTGIQDNAAAQAHAATGAVIAHAVGVAVPHAAGAAVTHAAGAGVLAHGNGAAVTHTGGNPVVAATATKITDSTFSLNVNTQAGDMLVLTYLEVGARVGVV
jgi:hypothetical protein